MSQTGTTTTTVVSVAAEDSTFTIPFAPGRTVRPVRFSFNTSVTDVYNYAFALSNLWIQLHDEYNGAILLMIPIDMTDMQIIDGNLIRITYNIQVHKFIKDDNFINSDLCKFCQLHVSVKSLVYGQYRTTRPLFVSPTKLFTMHAHQMEFECRDAEVTATSAQLDELGSVECITPEFITPKEWKDGRLHLDNYYWSANADHVHFTKLQRITLLHVHPSAQDLDSRALSAHISENVHMHLIDTHRRYAAMYQTFVEAHGGSTCEELERASGHVMTPMESKLVKAFQYGTCAHILRTVTRTIEFTPRVEGDMDIRYMRPEIVDALPEEDRSRCCFVLWRRNSIESRRGFAGVRYML